MKYNTYAYDTCQIKMMFLKSVVHIKNSPGVSFSKYQEFNRVYVTKRYSLAPTWPLFRWIYMHLYNCL